MKIAIPLAQGRLSMHFGHCEKFAFIEVDDDRNIVSVTEKDAPPHQPGLLPRWLGEAGVDVIIAGGMGHRAQSLFKQADIEVVIGAPAEEPRSLVENYLAGKLERGANPCDH